MINKLQFSAAPLEAVKVDMDLEFPETLNFSFTISGETDKKTLKKLIRVIKYSAKDAKPITNKT